MQRRRMISKPIYVSFREKRSVVHPIYLGKPHPLPVSWNSNSIKPRDEQRVPLCLTAMPAGMERIGFRRHSPFSSDWNEVIISLLRGEFLVEARESTISSIENEKIN